MTVKETVFSLEAARLRDDIKAKRAELRTNPANRTLELDIEAVEARVAQADRQHTHWSEVEARREADVKKQDADARAELEARLITDYRKSAPGTTEQEAKAALPDLLHRHRLAEQDRMDGVLAETKRRLGSIF